MEVTKPIRKTVYVNRQYYDVLPFFEQEGSSKLVCELIRTAMNGPQQDTQSQIFSLLTDIKEMLKDGVSLATPSTTSHQNAIHLDLRPNAASNTLPKTEVSAKDARNLLSAFD